MNSNLKNNEKIVQLVEKKKKWPEVPSIVLNKVSGVRLSVLCTLADSVSRINHGIELKLYLSNHKTFVSVPQYNPYCTLGRFGSRI